MTNSGRAVRAESQTALPAFVAEAPALGRNGNIEGGQRQIEPSGRILETSEVEKVKTMYDGDPPRDPDHTGEPVERDRGVFIGSHKHDDGPDDEGRDFDGGQDRDPELWGAQLPLIEEDEDDGLKLPGFSEESVPAILDAMGDDAAEPLQDAPNGTSATGSPFEPDHGGFPERD